jgi:hypothetical protein
LRRSMAIFCFQMQKRQQVGSGFTSLKRIKYQ